MSSVPVDEVTQIAINLARNAGYAVFPCLESKAPAIPGPGGYKHATTDPDRIAWLWKRYPAPLIGVATGAASRLWVLDVDAKHPEAFLWWQRNHHRLLPTRAYQTRSGGLHLHYRDGDGIGCSAGRICKGVDVRGNGGYAILWFAAGFACRDQSPPASWPRWLRAALQPPPPAAEPMHAKGIVHTKAAIAGIVRRVAEATEGERNAILFWGACRLLGHGLSRREIETLLLPGARKTGLPDAEARRTINSAHGRAA